MTSDDWNERGLNKQDEAMTRARRWLAAACLLCALALWGVAGAAWRQWRFERRGIERAPSAVGARSSRPKERRAGINVELAQYEGADLYAALADFSALNVHWLRQRFPWREIEPSPGVYAWERWDRIVEAAHGRGFGLIAVLDAPPPWALPGERLPLPCDPACDAQAYARFVGAFAARYGTAIDVYQVWDEPNLSRSWGGGHAQPCGYAVLLEAAYPALHGADPTATVLGGGLAPTQAPGPGDLNDLVYLRRLYAQGGGAWFDALAAKPYGFWSGPEDRRVDPQALNFSRIVAVREIMRARGDGEKAVWAVEWGWNVLPGGWEGEPPPWGSDTLAMQAPRILGAVVRARSEWPWLEGMAWAEYQPDRAKSDPRVDPRWGFALRDADGQPTALYAVVKYANRSQANVHLSWPLRPPGLTRWGWFLLSFLAGAGLLALLWRRCRVGESLIRVWAGWKRWLPLYQLCALLVVDFFYLFVPWPEWALAALVLAAILVYDRPYWALWGAVSRIPFFYWAKQVDVTSGVFYITPAEVLLYVAVLVAAVRIVRAGQGRWRDLRLNGLDFLWGVWVVWGAFSPAVAPDPGLAWREWRLCLLGAGLLYALLRLGPALDPAGFWQHSSSLPSPRQSRVWLAWLLSGVAVAALAIGQWMAGAIVQAGNVGRAAGVYYSPTHLALYLERIWPVALTVAFWGGLRKRWRRAAWAGVALLTAGLYVTYSRATWLLAVPAALAVVGVCYARRLRWWAIALLAAGVVAAATGVLVGRGTPLSGLLDEVRVPLWQSTLEIVADHPWLGVGLDGFRFVYPRYMRVEAWTEPLLYHPHNMWLDAAARMGLPGLALFGLLAGASIASAVAAVLRWRKNQAGGQGALASALAVGCLASLGAGLAHGWVDSGYFLVDLAWSLALVAGLTQGLRVRVSGIDLDVVI